MPRSKPRQRIVFCECRDCVDVSTQPVDYAWERAARQLPPPRSLVLLLEGFNSDPDSETCCCSLDELCLPHFDNVARRGVTCWAALPQCNTASLLEQVLGCNAFEAVPEAHSMLKAFKGMQCAVSSTSPEDLSAAKQLHVHEVDVFSGGACSIPPAPLLADVSQEATAALGLAARHEPHFQQRYAAQPDPHCSAPPAEHSRTNMQPPAASTPPAHVHESTPAGQSAVSDSHTGSSSIVGGAFGSRPGLPSGSARAPRPGNESCELRLPPPAVAAQRIRELLKLVGPDGVPPATSRAGLGVPDVDMLVVHMRACDLCACADVQGPQEACCGASVVPLDALKMRACMAWADALLKCLAAAAPQADGRGHEGGAAAHESVLLHVVASFAPGSHSRLALQPGTVAEQAAEKLGETGALARLHRPRQSWQLSGQNAVSVQLNRPVLIASYLRGVTRCDEVQRFCLQEALCCAGHGGLLVDRLVHEIAYKIGRAPKYGA